MKKITLLFSLCLMSIGAFAQIPQTFDATGQDDDPTVLTILPGDITVNGANTITALSLTNFVVHYYSETGSTAYCGTWYDFDLAIVGGVADGTTVTAGCSADFEIADIMGFTSITLTSNNIDTWSDTIYVYIDVNVTFAVTVPPNCDAVLTNPADGATDGAIDGNLTWSAASGAPDGYNLTVGTTMGGSEVLATTDVGNVTSYSVGALVPTTTYYVNLVPYNASGVATSCTENSFTTLTPPANDDCGNAENIPLSTTGSEVWVTGTTLYNTASGEVADADVSCGSFGSGRDTWFTVTVPDAGDITITTQGSIGSALADTTISVFSGTCGAMAGTEIECDDDGGTGNFSEISLTGQTPGATLYIRVQEYDADASRGVQDGDFEIAAHAVDPTLNTQDFDNGLAFTYFPNPVNNNLNLKAQKDIENVSVYNMLGQEVLRTVPNAVNTEVNMSALQAGAYFVKVTIGNVTETVKIIKN